MLANDVIDALLLGFAHVEKDYKREWGWWRYRLDGKLFAALLTLPEGYKGYRAGRVLTLKCDPAELPHLLETYPCITPGFYCDKRNYATIYLDEAEETVPAGLVEALCADAYRLAVARLTKKRRRELGI
ncbi:MAG: MmcQ/YjbR family DNA-binding protein [Clostridia bacterium]|nr:MmcQ/YjbR family DNA-binding protein [Clostridia bacterium]